jgi:mRNA-degrading endonuclease toxin of MazEF toxin-antitoxin module
MKRGEIYFADLSPTIGTDISKRRLNKAADAMRLHLDL